MNLQNLNDNSFLLDGVPHSKHYELKIGISGKVSLVSIYDSRDAIFINADINNISVNGVVATSLDKLMLDFEPLKQNFKGGGISPKQTYGYYNGTNFYKEAAFTTLIESDPTKVFTNISTGVNYIYDGTKYMSYSGGGDFKGSISPGGATPTASGTYVPTVSGTYANAGGQVVNLADGYTTLILTGSVWSKQVVPMVIAPETNSKVVSGNTKAVSGDNIFKYINGSTGTVGVLPIDQVGYANNTGSLTPSTDYKNSGYVLLEVGEKIEYGVNTGSNPSSLGAIFNTYTFPSKALLENRVKLKDYLSQFYEGTFTATVKCYALISTNDKGSFGVAYLRKISANSLPFIVKGSDLGLTVAKQSDLNTLANSITSINETYLNNKTQIKAGDKILLSGQSFSTGNIGWFELMCTKLAVTGVNKSFSGERINSFSSRILNGTFFTQQLLNECGALMIMHTHNKDIYTLGDITVGATTYTASQLESFTAAQYEATGWGLLTDSATGFNGPDFEFAALWDYVIKKIQTIYYEERNNSLSVYYETKWGKPFNVVLTTNWHDGRTKFNQSVRKLCEKWGMTLVRFDDNTGFTRKRLHISGLQHSVLYARINAGNVIDLEVIDGQEYAWHPAGVLTNPLIKRLAASAIDVFEVI